MGVWAFWIDYEDRRADAITRAWTLLTTPAPGNSGKREALEFLNTREPRIPLVGIDLSCQTMGGGWHAETYECDSLVYLEEVELKGAILTYAHLEGADLILADLQGAVLWNADLQEADLTGAYLEGVNLWDADLQGANLSRADFTRARFYHTVFSDPKTGQRAWAWADEPPVGLDRVDIQPCVFDEARNDRYTRPDPCIPPNPEDQR